MVDQSRRNFLKVLGFTGLSLTGFGILFNNEMEKSFSKYMGNGYEGRYDTVVVPGVGLNGRGELPYRAKQRIDDAIPFYQNSETKKLVFTGGLAKDGNLSEAEAMSLYALDKGGISSSDILKEEKSVSTLSNIYHTKVDILEPNKYKTNAFITDNIHLTRLEYLTNKVLGDGYNSYFKGFDVKAPEEEIEKWKDHEKKSMTAYRLLLNPVPDGNHELVRDFAGILPLTRF